MFLTDDEPGRLSFAHQHDVGGILWLAIDRPCSHQRQLNRSRSPLTELLRQIEEHSRWLAVANQLYV
jgi:hypothetical protein